VEKDIHGLILGCTENFIRGARIHYRKITAEPSVNFDLHLCTATGPATVTIVRPKSN
jgi:hypothetical protein